MLALMGRISLILGVFSCCLCAQSMKEISGQRIRADVKFLSSDLLEGRGVGTRGGELATDYIASQLAIAGAKPAGDNGTFFQRVPLVGVTTQADAELRATKSGKTVPFKWQDDFVGSTHRQHAHEDIDGEVV